MHIMITLRLDRCLRKAYDGSTDGHSSPSWGRILLFTSTLMRPSHVIVLATLFSITGSGLVTAPVLATSTVEAVEPCQTAPSTPSPSSTANVELSELYPSPADGEEEFIELHNASNTSVDLAGWSISDASGKTFTLPADDSTISAGGYRAFPFSQTKIYLNNDSDTVTLWRPDASSADTTTYEKAAKGSAWARIGSTQHTWEWTATSTPDAANKGSATAPPPANEEQERTPSNQTPTNPTPTPPPTESSDAVIINELLPNPSGSETTDEWIELTNTGDTSINLTGWQLTDQTRYFTIADTRIPAHGYVVFESGETRINLNNTGDTVYLVDAAGAIMNGTTYEAAAEEMSWANSTTSWAWTSTPTPGKQNVLQTNEEDENDEPTSPDDPSELSIAEAQQQPDGATISITGVVSVTPGIFSTQYFYIQDSSGGIQIYSYAKQFPELAVGDLVVVNGEKSTVRGEPRIKISTSGEGAEGVGITVLKNNSTLPITVVPALEEALPGTLARITGTVTNATSTSAMIDDVTPITIKSTTGVRKDQFPVGETVSVTGVVLQSSDGSALVPRSPSDIELLNAEPSLISAAHAAEPVNNTGQSETQKQNTQVNTTATRTTTQSTAGILIVVLAAAGIVVASVVVQLKKKKEVARRQATSQTLHADARPISRPDGNAQTTGQSTRTDDRSITQTEHQPHPVAARTSREVPAASSTGTARRSP